MSTDNVIKFRPSPAQVSETGINELWDYAVALMHSEAARLLNKPLRRAFDLSFEYTSFAPPAERWTCIDLNTYDGAPDSEGVSTFMGRGATEYAARRDLLAQFDEHDNPERPATSAERELDEAIDEALDFDLDLEDRA
jgi:hypothetical protein